MKKNSFYITTAIMYVNARPHLGYALEVVQADVLARYYRSLGKEVFYLTGTDEHGIKIQKAAEEKGVDPGFLSKENTKLTKELAQDLGASFDYFIRTSDQKTHWPAVKKIWEKLKSGGDLEKRKYRGIYCVGCEAFLREGDLVGGKCPVHEKEPEIVEEVNWFFKLSKYQDILKNKIKEDEIRIVPKSRKNEVLAFIEKGLDDVSFSRDKKKLHWGIPVPGDKDQTIYVWCDALTNYISAIDYAEESASFKKYWPADIHIIGKDILRFHALCWPAMLLSAGIDLPKTIMAHGFITSSGRKMSKSSGNVVDPKEIIEKYGVDPLRYYLLRAIPTLEDGDFTIEHFEEIYRADLSNDLGNLLQRTLTMINKYDVRIKKQKDLKCGGGCAIGGHIENFEFNKALERLWSCIATQNKLIDEKKPWELAKEGKTEELREVLQKIYDFLVIFSIKIHPFLPETSEKIKNQLSSLKPEPLFPRLEE